MSTLRPRVQRPTHSDFPYFSHLSGSTSTFSFHVKRPLRAHTQNVRTKAGKDASRGSLTGAPACGAEGSPEGNGVTELYQTLQQRHRQSGAAFSSEWQLSFLTHTKWSLLDGTINLNKQFFVVRHAKIEIWSIDQCRQQMQGESKFVAQYQPNLNWQMNIENFSGRLFRGNVLNRNVVNQ